ncbi:MAG: CHASE domain-containing protein [Burkholderiales bacterium]
MSRNASAGTPAPTADPDVSPLPFLAAVIGVLVTSLLCMFVHDQSSDAASTRFDAGHARRADPSGSAHRRLRADPPRRRGSGAHLSGPRSASWAQYYRSLQIPRRFPGMQTFLWVPLVPPGDARAFERRQQRRGHPDFRIWTRDAIEPVTTIALVEPFEGVNRKALGFDMFSESIRRAAMMRARDSGDMAITRNVTLVIDDRPLAGFIMFIPVYRGGVDPGAPQARRDALLGFVASAFRVEDLLQATLAHRMNDLRVRVYDGHGTQDSTLMHDTRPTEDADPWMAPAYRLTTTRRVGSRTWTVTFDSTPAFEARVADNRATLVAIAGLLLTALGTWATSLAVSLRRRTAVLSALTDSLERNRADLEHANTELISARDAALAAAKAKSEFLANMSHEIRTPIHGFLGHTELALGNPLDAQTRGFLETARDCGQALLGVVNDILDFSKLEAERFELDHADFEPRALLLECARTVALTAQEHGVALIWSAGPDVPDRLSGDPKRLRQVLLNLLSNAVKFTRAGDVELAAVLQSADPAGVRIEFSIRDTGIGMTAETRTRLFQAFYQADASITREFGGTGLGLAISARIVGLMGGRLAVESEPGVGSVFRFTAAFGRPSLPAASPAPLARPAVIVDAHPRRAEATRRLLSSLGLAGRVAASIEAALASAPTDAVWIVDGAALTTAPATVRRVWRETARTALILAASSADRRTFDDGQANGASVLARPLDPAQVRAALTCDPTRSSSSPSSDTVVAGAGRSVLVAEDNPVNRTLIARMLERLGQRITLAENGAEAVKAFEAGRYDVVLMDIQMPEMDGLEATRRIRALEANHPGRRTPIFALTADTLPGDRERCLDAGMDGHLAKPLSMDQLRAALESDLPRQQAA